MGVGVGGISLKTSEEKKTMTINQPNRPGIHKSIYATCMRYITSLTLPPTFPVLSSLLPPPSPASFANLANIPIPKLPIHPQEHEHEASLAMPHPHSVFLARAPARTPTSTSHTSRYTRRCTPLRGGTSRSGWWKLGCLIGSSRFGMEGKGREGRVVV